MAPVERSPSKEHQGGALRWLADQILTYLQRRCEHPGKMVAVDVLEGGAEASNISVSYCRRCGAIKVNWSHGRIFVPEANQWRLPDPNLWRGK